MRKRNCFLDFDGTIVCNKKRLYNFFIDNINPEFKEALKIDEFWNLKKMGINEISWLNEKYEVNMDLASWNRLKFMLIEQEEYLDYNEIFDYSIEALTTLKRRYNLFLITRRSNVNNLLSEIEKFKLTGMFNDILITPHGKYTKAEYIKSNVKYITEEDIFIGDTEDDIYSAIDLGIKPIFVRSGIRSEWIIKRYFRGENILIIDNISCI